MRKYFLLSALMCVIAFCGCRRDEIADNDSTSASDSSAPPPSVSADDIEEEDFGTFSD